VFGGRADGLLLNDVAVRLAASSLIWWCLLLASARKAAWLSCASETLSLSGCDFELKGSFVGISRVDVLFSHRSCCLLSAASLLAVDVCSDVVPRPAAFRSNARR
jgi:hypothetical protein